MTASRTSSARLARLASRTLRRRGASKSVKALAGSVLSQARRRRRKGRRS